MVYSRRNGAREFVYPKAKAIELAKPPTPPFFYGAEILSKSPSRSRRGRQTDMWSSKLKAGAIMAIQRREEVLLAQVVTPPQAQVEMAMATPDGEGAFQPRRVRCADRFAGIMAIGGAFVLRTAENALRG